MQWQLGQKNAAGISHNKAMGLFTDWVMFYRRLMSDHFI